jgi:uncharacterized protein YbaR (Trm112 family)/SAM-dependent methyltransferase
MKRRLVRHIVCPIHKTPLELVAWETRRLTLSAAELARAERMGIDPEELSEDVVHGVLLNRAQRLYYPIAQGVPRLLPFETGVGQDFAKKHAQRLAQELPGFALPSAPAAPGEYEVLRSFSNEWVSYDWDGQSYWNLSAESWFRCMRFVLGFEQHPTKDRLVLEVGIGIGGVADNNARTEECELVGIDLGYAVDPAYAHFGTNPFLHIVQASAFAPPFPARTFDFVYSFGVLHHTYSTRTAFDSVAKLPKQDGRLYVWVYSPHDESRNLIRRVLMTAENVIRPVTSRLPDTLQTMALAPLVPLYVGYQAARSLRRSQAQVRYGWREAMHAARDRFAPRYIHRHSDEELMGWFREAGYRDLTTTSGKPRPEYVPVAFTACAGVDGVRGG